MNAMIVPLANGTKVTIDVLRREPLPETVTLKSDANADVTSPFASSTSIEHSIRLDGSAEVDEPELDPTHESDDKELGVP